ncbi:MAG: hypothetical protein ACC656_01960 [Candidatus Heimdallarchaeota archaeon]
MIYMNNNMWLETLKSKLLEGSQIPSKEEKREFWKKVGQLKRLDKPNLDEISLLSDIREILHKDRFGDPCPTNVVLPISAVLAIGMVYSIILKAEDDTVWLGLILSWLLLAILATLYSWVVNIGRKVVFYVFVLLVFSTVSIDIFLLYNDKELFAIFNQIGLIILVPTLYLHGRYIGGLVSGIKFDGVVRDIYYLVTMKINYQSYLSAKPNKRQWIFFTGGIGTVITSSVASLIALIIFSNPYLFIVPILLLFGELLDYAFYENRVAKGEFHHLRRGRRIIRDWKKTLKTNI